MYTMFRNNARFLWKRLPAEYKSQNKEVEASWKVGQAMWTRSYSEAHRVLLTFPWGGESLIVARAVAGIQFFFPF